MTQGGPHQDTYCLQWQDNNYNDKFKDKNLKSSKREAEINYKGKSIMFLS